MKTPKVRNNLFKDSGMGNARPGLEGISKLCSSTKFEGHGSVTVGGSERLLAWDRNLGGRQ